jgi:D-alanyl-D-alanine carboxypeptidase
MRPRSSVRALPALFVILCAVTLLLLHPSPVSADAPSTEALTASFATIREPLPPGSQAIVRADGDCLRMREQPGVGARVLTCLPEGAFVTVLTGVHEDVEYRWQQVERRGSAGWVADQYLEASPGAPQCDTSAIQRPGLHGDLAPSGVGIAIWGGGTTNGILTSALTRGVQLRSVWAQQTGTGRLVGYLVGVPDFVNQSWFNQFPGGRLPAGTVLVVLTGSSTEAQSASSLLPAWGPAPAQAIPMPAPRIGAAAAVVIDEASGQVLYAKDAHRVVAPASLTKMATAILAIEGADLDSWALNEVDSRRMVGSSVMGLLPGDCFQVRDLLYGLMLPSGNDAALAIGRHIAGSDGAFVQQMNTLVARLGLENTRFANPHGLDARGHATSAYDLAMIARYGMSLPTFQQVVAQPAWVSHGSRTIPMKTYNRFLSSYPGADGLKTGFTEEAGRTLAVSATRDGRRVIAVLLNDPDRFEDAAKLLDWVFATHRWG